jgi:hypothetical protein
MRSERDFIFFSFGRSGCPEGGGRSLGRPGVQEITRERSRKSLTTRLGPTKSVILFVARSPVLSGQSLEP